MPPKKTRLDRFSDLSWIDIEEWAGGKIVSRGKSYQRRGRVSDLAVTDDGGLIAWVEGTKRYAAMVERDEEGLLDSICTCPYEMDCKHGVAVVLEYLKRVEEDRRVPGAKEDDERFALLEEEAWDDEPKEAEISPSEDMRRNIDGFLKGKTKAQLIDFIHEIAEQYPEITRDLADREVMISGNIGSLITRLRQEIRDLGDEPGWGNYWEDEGFTPDYSGIRKKLGTLLKAGHADEALTLGRELVTIGARQVEESHDEGETAMEIADCMPVIVEALDQSSLNAADKLNWALEAVLQDEFAVCEVFAKYLHKRHPKTTWSALADRLLAQLKSLKHAKGRDDFNRNYERNRLSDWAVHALERAGRKDEIIPLCEAETKQTANYDRLVKRLVAARRHKEAEYWIHIGVKATKEKRPGIAVCLRDELRRIRAMEKNWSAVSVMRVEEFVRHPSRQAFMECKKACGKAKVWSKVREYLLRYLEKGKPPWKQKGWPLPESGLDQPETHPRERFPLLHDLIEIAILEKKPEQALKWYDLRPKGRWGWRRVDEDVIATAVQTHAPDRAAALWKNKAEGLIAEVKPSAYHEAAKYLQKAARIMRGIKKQAEWKSYLHKLREKHRRKRRLIGILDGLEGKPILQKRR